MIELIEVKDKAQLKKNINGILKNAEIIGSDAVSFIQKLKNLSEVYIIGGALRNVLNKEAIRDIDIIVGNVIESNILDLLPKKPIVNRLGGIKLRLSKITIDFWPVTENWANKRKLIYTEHILIDEIAKGTFLNFDSIVYGLRANVLNCRYYNKCVKTRTLDIIKHNKKYVYTNPNRTANIMRAFYLRGKYGLSFSPFLSEYISLQVFSLNYEHSDIRAHFKKAFEAYPKYHDYLSQRQLFDEIGKTLELNRGRTPRLF
jgi:hypothetical protein